MLSDYDGADVLKEQPKVPETVCPSFCSGLAHVNAPPYAQCDRWGRFPSCAAEQYVFNALSP
jgi:hypothetical protein